MMLRKLYAQQQAKKAQATPAPAQAAQPTQASQPDTEMRNEEVKASEPTQREKVMQKFAQILAADKAYMAVADNNDQNPHSRAYISTCSFSKQKTLTKEEERLSMVGYAADVDKKMDALDARQELKEIVRKSLITTGGFPQAKVDQVF